MVPFAEAYDSMLGVARTLGSEPVPLEDAVNRILAEDVRADVDMPPFDKAAMDGYACRHADLGTALDVIETVPAGRMPSMAVGPGQCSRIMTGAPLPKGADCVIMQEHTEPAAPGRVRFTGKSTEANICRRAEDLAKGDIVLRRGDRIAPAHIAVLASMGVTRPVVARQPRVAVAATGSELVPPDQTPEGAMIRDSNSRQLVAQVRGVGAIADHMGIVPDSESQLTDAIRQAKGKHDLVILSGGVSTGAFDFVPAALKQCGFELLFESVAMQPGRPTVFGLTSEGVFCCGLPGNPVSTYVVFELMLRPFLLKMMGHAHRPTVVRARLAGGFKRRKPDRQTAVPVRFLTPDTVAAVEYHGSAHINALCSSDALLVVAPGVSSIPEGETVDVRLL